MYINEIPTVPPAEETLPVVLELLTIDENCMLPCFWDFELGESTTQETTDFVVEAFGQVPYIAIYDENEDPNNLLDSSSRGMDFYATFLPLTDGQLEIIFRSIDDILVRVDIKLFKSANWIEKNPFILPVLLSTYGEPTKVYLRYSGASTIGYTLAVVYEEQGFIVEYGFGNNPSSNQRLLSERITDDGRLLICAKDTTYDTIHLTLQIDGNPIPLTKVLQPPLKTPSVFRPFWDIEDMTGLTIEEFMDAFVDNPEACIEAFLII